MSYVDFEETKRYLRVTHEADNDLIKDLIEEQEFKVLDNALLLDRETGEMKEGVEEIIDGSHRHIFHSTVKRLVFFYYWKERASHTSVEYKRTPSAVRSARDKLNRAYRAKMRRLSDDV